MSVRAMREDEVAITPPSKVLLVLEGRAFGEYAAFVASWPLLRLLPKGDGHSVMVVPGFGGSDLSTRPLRRTLQRLGYDAHGWGLGRNLGVRPALGETLRGKVAELHQRQGRKVSLIGWSLGGVYVRELARHLPDRVRRVITLGSPINGHPQSNNADRVYRWINRGRVQKVDWEGHQRRRVAPPVPCTSIYSKTDGIVHWRCSLEEEGPNTENVEVYGSHCGLGFNPLALRIVAERLARPEPE